MQKEKISKIIDIINWGDAYFKERDITESRLNIELMLCNILNCKRMNLYLNFDRPLVKNELETLREYVKRRITREPLQYILGETEFMGLPFKVNKNVLIPRQETELLVEQTIKLSKSKTGQHVRILDIGTGSGNISISLAKFICDSEITAIDSSAEAIEIARQNAELNEVSGNINFIISDILNENPVHDVRFDIIVSNPPYIPLSEYSKLEPELGFEPSGALTDSSDGLNFYRRISSLAISLLAPGGFFAVEIAYDQGETVSALFKESGFSNVNIIKDYSDLDRIITGENN
jgi:release factor glutamine methyltransferase